MARPTAKETKVVKRGSDELDFLGSRARSVPLGAPLVREKTTELTRRVLATDGYVGAESHDHGSDLIELYMRHADATLGYRTFRTFLEVHWPLDISVAYERMRVARLCTHDQAAKYGYTTCVLGLRIMRALGIETFAEFLARPLKRHRDDGGGTVRFPASAVELRSVLREIATRANAADGDAPPDLARQMRRYRAVVDELAESEPLAASLKPIVWADANGVYVRVTAGGESQARAAARLYQKLARLGG